MSKALSARGNNFLEALGRAASKDLHAEKPETARLTREAFLGAAIIRNQDILQGRDKDGKKLPQPREADTVSGYMARVFPRLTKIQQVKIHNDALDIGTGVYNTSKVGNRQLYYDIYVHSTWQEYCGQHNFDTDWRAYVTMKSGLPSTTARRMADTLWLIHWLYQDVNIKRYGLEDLELPDDPHYTIQKYWSEFHQHAHRIFNLTVMVSNLARGSMVTWKILREAREDKEFDPEDPDDYSQKAQLYRAMWRVRKMLGLARGKLTDKQVAKDEYDQGPVGIPPIRWGDRPTPAQMAWISSMTDGLVQFGGEYAPEMEETQYKLEFLPLCPECGSYSLIDPEHDGGFYCHACDELWTHKEVTRSEPQWWTRKGGEDDWHYLRDAPEVPENTTNETLDVFGVRVFIFNVLEEATVIDG